jgi:aminoglycoside phosphotransferase (APT) family kinase protein
MTDQAARDAGARPRTSTRDLADLRERLADWLGGRLGAPVTVTMPSRPETNGMSSETLLFAASWTEGGRGRRAEYAARMAPAAQAVPVFPDYDLVRQFEVMRLVRERAGVPAPRALWLETDSTRLGAPFLVMERIRGRIPPDVPPYTFEGWLLDASPGDRARLQWHTVEMLTRLHHAPFTAEELRPFQLDRPGESALRRHFAEQQAYYEWAHGALRIPLLERTADRLAELWPADSGPEVLNWGDARIGNMVYRDFSPVAVLDWEMAGVGPPELDLGWMIFLHRFFQDIATVFGLPGLPDFMGREDVCAAYRELSGHEPRNMEFYEMYAALRHGIVMARVWHRRIHFGELAMPEDPDDLVMHRALLEQMLDGSYWSRPAGR